MIPAAATIVCFEIDGNSQADLDLWANMSRFNPVLIDGQHTQLFVVNAYAFLGNSDYAAAGRMYQLAAVSATAGQSCDVRIVQERTLVLFALPGLATFGVP